MTIIIGIKCAAGILVGCESRTTQPSGYINDDARKLHRIELADGNSAIIAEAGNAEFACRAIEKISVAAEKTTMSDYRSIAKCVEDSISDFKQEIRKQYQGTAEELQKHFENYGFELMIAHYWQDEPYIFTLNFANGIAIKRDADYSAIGCGAILADFLISRIDLSQFGTAHGMWTIAYAVEEIKRFDGRCGGRTRAALVRTKNRSSIAQLYEDAAMQEAIDEAIAYADKYKSEWSDVARHRIESVVQAKTKQT